MTAFEMVYHQWSSSFALRSIFSVVPSAEPQNCFTVSHKRNLRHRGLQDLLEMLLGDLQRRNQTARKRLDRRVWTLCALQHSLSNVREPVRTPEFRQSGNKADGGLGSSDSHHVGLRHT